MKKASYPPLSTDFTHYYKVINNNNYSYNFNKIIIFIIILLVCIFGIFRHC